MVETQRSYVQPKAEGAADRAHYVSHPFSYPPSSQTQSPQFVMFYLLLVVVTHFLLLIWRIEACYFIDGSRDEAASPCFDLNLVGASMCCFSDETCLAEGLCAGSSPHGPVGEYDNGSSIWRRSCSDKEWRDMACLAIAPCRCFICHLPLLPSAGNRLADKTPNKSSPGYQRSWVDAKTGPSAHAAMTI